MTGLRDLEENDVKIQQVVNVLAQNAGPSKEQVGQALATLVGWLQVQQASGLETESETSEESSLLIMMASAVFLIGLLAGCLMTMLVWWWRRVRSPKLIFYKGPMSVVLHLDKGCHYLKKTKKVEEWEAVPMVQQGQAQNRLTCSPLFTLVNSSYALEKRRAQY